MIHEYQSIHKYLFKKEVIIMTKVTINVYQSSDKGFYDNVQHIVKYSETASAVHSHFKKWFENFCKESSFRFSNSGLLTYNAEQEIYELNPTSYNQVYKLKIGSEILFTSFENKGERCIVSVMIG